jgi:hypothetical protein
MTTTHWGLAEAHQEVVEAVRAVAEETEGPILAGRPGWQGGAVVGA